MTQPIETHSTKIRRLPEELIKRIAAGEVVERPASVVKELIENSLDAGSQKVSVLVKGAGRLLIRVIDDGTGMGPEDLRLAVERHTTSKIWSVEDLDKIMNLGFRGEALYTIAAVSRLDILSRIRDAEMGSRLRVEGGIFRSLLEEGAAPGTVVEVKDLFWNTPARLKFLRSETTEINHIFEVMAMHALARPDVGFQLKDGDRTLMDVPPRQSLQARIEALYQGLGRDWIQVLSASQGIRVSGFVAHPKLSRIGRDFQYFFVNRRPIKSPGLAYAVEAAFHSLISEGRHPVFFVFLELDPSAVDVNVHPSKREVRFHRTQEIQSHLREAIRKSLSEHYAAPSANIPQKDEALTDRVADSLRSFFDHPSAMETRDGWSPPSKETKSVHFANGEAPLIKKNEIRVRALGCFDDLYWVVLLEDGLAILDQHAAHERVLYEKFLNAWRQKKIEVQQLLLPVTLDLPQEDCLMIQEYRSTLNDLGFGVEDFGSSSVLISQVPSYCETHQLREMMTAILDDLRSFKKSMVYAEHEIEKKIILRACKSAVKAHDCMSLEEIQTLVQNLFSLELPYTCPHGRPTLVKFTENDLAKMFKRK